MFVTTCTLHGISPFFQLLQLVPHLLRKVVVDLLLEEMLQLLHLVQKELLVRGAKLRHRFLGDVRAFQVDGAIFGHEANGGLLAHIFAVTTTENPIQNSRIFTETCAEEKQK